MAHHSTAEITDYSQGSLEETTQLFEGTATKQTAYPRHPSREQKHSVASHAAPSSCTTTTEMSEETRYHSHRRKSSSSGSADSSSRSSITSPSAAAAAAAPAAHPTASSTQRRSMPAIAPKKTAHNMIEKRYRTNLNANIAALRDSVPSLRVMVQRLEQPYSEDGDAEVDKEDLGGLAPAHKLNKATVLSKATEYITHLERRNKNLANQNASLRSKVEGLQMMVERADMEDEEADQQAP